MTTTELTQGAVESRDGTRIGYWKTGRGPAVVLVHGSMESSRSHRLLAQALADEFTVYLLDRRGRGLSGPHRPDHCARTEVEDIEAVLTLAGAEFAFGVSAGGAVVIEAARTLPVLRKVAVYEKMLVKEEREVGAGAITMRKLAPTIHQEGALIAELAGTFDAYREVSAEVLLMGGGKGLAALKPWRDKLEEALPHCRRVELDGLDHGASSDPGGTNPRGSAEAVGRIAAEIRAFLRPASY
jgi:pimeloyl-ACP methyl ester carboxylesterase